MERWNEVTGNESAVDDRSARPTSDRILAVESPELLDEEAYPTDWVIAADGRRPF